MEKIDADYQHLRRFRTQILVIGGIGSLVAAFSNGWEQYVAITTAGVAALTTYTQLKMYGQVYPMYHATVGKLDAVVADWRGLPRTQRDDPARRDEFVTKIENIFNDERLKWMEQATQAMINGDQSLMRNVSDWTSGFDSEAPTVDVNGAAKTQGADADNQTADQQAAAQNKVNNPVNGNGRHTNNGESDPATTPSAEKPDGAKDPEP